MVMMKFAALAVVCCVFTLALKKDQPAFAFLVSLCGAACLMIMIAQQLEPLVGWLRALAQYTKGQSVSCLLQVLGIAIASQFASDLCKEGGLNAAASAVELAGRMLALLQALPMLQSLVSSFLAFLQ